MSGLNTEIKKKLGAGGPAAALNKWLAAALNIRGLKEPWAAALSTSFKGKASCRIVLLKSFKKGRLFFYTNYLSRKGRELNSSPQASLNLFWPQLKRQVRIEGIIKKTSRKHSLLYWRSRSRESRLSQWVSRQSEKAPASRRSLEALKKSAEKKFLNKDIPCPPHWGGYALSIQSIEFWIEGKHRLHDRFLFEKTKKGWKKQRLFP